MKKLHIHPQEVMAFFGGLVFYAPVSLLVRTQAGVSLQMFFLLQVLLSLATLLLEIPSGRLSDRIGYHKTLLLATFILFCARSLLLWAFLDRNLTLFVIEALLEGAAFSLFSGTESAYLYATVDHDQYAARSARISNFNNAGFILSTLSYALIYRAFDLTGLLVATALSTGAGTLAALRLKAVPIIKSEKAPRPKLIFDRKILLFTLLLPCLSLGCFMVNFFYADKLLALALPMEALTPIIFGYSVLEMCAERILRPLKRQRYPQLLVITLALAGGMLLIFGAAQSLPVALPIMLLLPLILSLPGYLIDALQNEHIDTLRLEDNRAELLSMMNIGTSLLEIVFLFASSLLSQSSAAPCFYALGLLTVIMAACAKRLLK